MKMHIDETIERKKKLVGEREMAIDTNACLNWCISSVEINWVVGYKR